MNLTASEATKFKQLIKFNQGSSRYFLSFAGEVLRWVLLWFFSFSTFFQRKRIACAEKRLISPRPGEVIQAQNRYRTIEAEMFKRIRPRPCFHFWHGNSHLTNSTVPAFHCWFLWAQEIRFIINFFCAGLDTGLSK